ncbi:thiopeptide-type bacteriocin biosynthesis protein [Hamadaea flava]|uniref:Lantibiotic dehydratase n=1 Tax=Hamadaea flava TaxID=1742688 RepID=A0ABV8LJY9_9ACTN|nr:lantibiotic dehydratase [Hamadaea flava]MCP2325233.1 thiopeptide-type bacteriocin biosynthesis protein [Hamadaea flava]
MYRSVNNALMLRASVLHPGYLASWPDLTTSNGPGTWRPWLEEALSIPWFAAALAHASPDLAERTTAAVKGDLPPAAVRRVVLGVMRYLLRATSRATPFGLFAGVAPATANGTATLRWGADHRPFARLQAAWLAGVLDGLESDPLLRPHLIVRANNLLVERSGKVVLEYRAATSDPRGAPAHLRIKANDSIRAALSLAAEPISWADLSGKLAAEHGAPSEGADRLIGQMVAQRLLLTSLRPPSIQTDPLTHAVNELEALATGSDIVLSQLRTLRHLRARHDNAPDQTSADERRRDLSRAAAAIRLGPAVGIDLRLDCDLVLPRAVTAEAGRAAAALTHLARPSARRWRDWHARFLNRYGLRALVPILDAVDGQVGLGYPDGFTGEPAEDATELHDRDRRLLALAQRAALRGEHEVVLDDASLERVAGAAPTEVYPTAELTVRVHAESLQAIDRGDFQLSIVRASGQAFSTAGRFLDLFGEAAQQRMAAEAVASPTASEGALLAQLTAVTRYTISLDVNRAGQLLPHLIPVGEHHRPSQATIALDDIAVTADVHRLYLISISRQRALQPVAVNAVEPVRHAHPLARFLAEAPVALATACTPLEWGPAAKGLPFLPALRYGRTLLSPARWHLAAEELPNRHAPWPDWDTALGDWQEATGCPRLVALGVGDQTIRLDLGEPAHRALLRDHLTREPTALLRATADGNEWIGGHAHEIVIPLFATATRPPAPRISQTTVDGRNHGILPGGDHHYLKIYARPDEQDTILSSHLPRLLSRYPEAGPWWYLRYADPEPHLRLRLPGVPREAVYSWTRQLHADDLTRRVQWDTDFPEPGRFGGPGAYVVTTAVFGVDSEAALAELATSLSHPAIHRQALTAASMVDLVHAVIGDPAEAMRWLISHARTHRPAPARTVYDDAVRLANPYNHFALRAQPGGVAIAERWAARRRVITAWRSDLPGVSITSRADLLPDLLHLHHVRVIGLDLESERACLHLARAAALSWTTRSTP